MSGDSAPGRREGGDPRLWLRRVIFGHDTAAGKAFDVILIVAILVSVAVVMLDSVERYALRHGPALRRAEWVFTIMFTIEYLLRLYSAPSARKYATSFYGVIDLLAVTPSYLALFFPGGRYLISIRILRILRVFRVLKLAQFVGGERVIIDALKASRHKIAVFLISVLTVVVVVGSILYVVEGAEAGFTSIPRSVYWAIVTLTTVGYGDIAPQTPIGQMLASMIMILGYGMIAVPTGIVTVEMAAASRSVEMAAASRSKAATRPCAGCGQRRHDPDAGFCKSCGRELEADQELEREQKLEPPRALDAGPELEPGEGS
jgi:voltage-gated potassium channel